MSTHKDDYEAVRTVVEAVKGFEPKDQERIFRWAAEKLGLSQPAAPLTSALQRPEVTPPAAPVSPAAVGAEIDIKTFMTQKKPRNDIQFAAAVAYFYRFEAPQAERKDEIDKDVLQESARKAGHKRFSNPLATLSNAHRLGLLDKGAEKGTFTLNSVGENLVAMTLPDGNTDAKPVKKKTKKKTPAKKAARKGAKA